MSGNLRTIPAEPQALISLSIDGMAARYLGPYGNTAVATPGINRLASQAILFENSWARSCNGTIPAAWGWDALDELMRRSDKRSGRPARWLLITDDREVAAWGQGKFDEVISLHDPLPNQLAVDVAETCLARFFGEALSYVDAIAPGDFLLLHSRGLRFPWDAPFDYRLATCGEGDPEPPRELEFPLGHYAEVDPDQRLGWQQAYLGQLSALDECLDLFADCLQASSLPILWALSSPLSFPLGEHGFLGVHPDCVYDDALHVPLLVGDPRCPESARVPTLVHADRWIEIMSEALAGKQPPHYPILPDREREWLISSSVSALLPRAKRTHGWKVIERADGIQELYVKPDDRWEKNDVAVRCRTILPLFETLSLNQRTADDQLPNELHRPVQ